MLMRALNHMAAPRMDWAAFLELAKSLDCVGVEFRNDLEGELFDGVAPEDVGAAAIAAGLRVLSLAEVKAFDDWSEDKRSETNALAKIAKTCGAEMISLIARNDGKGMSSSARQTNLRIALRELRLLLEKHGLVGLIEPLGFETCALRDKGEVVEAIEELGGKDRFKIVHDTFHHTRAGGGPIYAEYTGMVHVSGVTDPNLSTSEMQDELRVLVDEQDRLGTISQLSQLLAAGYDGPISFEPFAADVHSLTEPYSAYARSFQFIEAELERAH